MALPIYVEPGRLTLKLTPAEYRVLDAFLQDGCTNAEIAGALFLSEDTIKTHMKRILEKSGADNRAALAVMVLTGRARVVQR